MGSAVPASTAPPVPSQALPPPGAHPEAEQGVHVHLVQRVHLQGQRERHRLSPTCAGVLWVPTPRHSPAAREAGPPHLLLLAGRGVGDVVAGRSLGCHLPPAQGGPGVQGAAGAQRHRHLVLAAAAVVVEAHRGPQLGAVCGHRVSRVADRGVWCPLFMGPGSPRALTGIRLLLEGAALAAQAVALRVGGLGRGAEQ